MKKYIKSKSLCPLPFSGLYIGPNGQIRCCSISRTNLGNIHDDPIESIVQGETVKKIRREMLEGKFPENCTDCYTKESSHKNINLHNISNRLYHIGKLKEAPFHLYKDENNFELLQLDARWRNTCNGACVYCGPKLSSRWAVELDKKHRIEKPVLTNNLDYVMGNIKKLKMLYLCGGEPFLIKENLALLETISREKRDLDIRINTNLSEIDNPMFDVIKTLPNVHWILSAEAMGSEFEYIRYPLKWSTFIENLEVIKGLPHRLSLNMAWNILNAHGIFEFIDFMIGKGIHPNSFVLNYVDGPDIYDVRNLPEEDLQNIKDTAHEKLTRLSDPFMLKYCYESIVSHCNKSRMNKLVELKKELATLDNRRNIDSKEIFPSLHKLLERTAQ